MYIVLSFNYTMDYYDPGEEELICVAHYKKSCSTYSTLKSLSQNQYDRLLKAKSARDDCDAANKHEKQCSSIPLTGLIKIVIYDHVMVILCIYCVPHNTKS